MESRFSKNRLHIGVNTLFLIPGEVGGTETYLCKTLDAVCRIFPTIRLTLFTNIENHPVLCSMLSRYPQVGFSKLNFQAANRPIRIVREQTELPCKARKAGIDVMWNPGCTAPFMCHSPQVVTIHDMQYKMHPEDLSWSARLVTDLLIKAAAKRAHKFITISNFSKTEIIRFTSIPEEQLYVTPLAADDIGCDGKKLDILQDTPYILTVANSYPHKNLHTLVDAFSRIEDKIPHRLVIVGKPRRGEKKLIESISRISDPNRVLRIQGLSHAELLSLYQSADLFVFPSLYEGFGLPVLEAMMAEVPVVTTRMASIPEVGGKYAIYVAKPTPEAFSQTILETMGWDRAYRSAFTAAAKRWAKTFSWEKTAEKTIQVLTDTARFDQINLTRNRLSDLV